MSPSQFADTGNGLPVVVPPLLVVVAARPERLAPRSSPYQSGFPCVVAGPSQILVMTAASCLVMTPHGVTRPMSLPGFQSHAFGLVMTPSVVPHASR